MLTITVMAFALAWWLGLYLLSRDPRKPLLRRAGLGLLAYALALACTGLVSADPAITGTSLLAHVGTLVLFVPALCWSGVLFLLLPDALPVRIALERAWRWALVPCGGALLGLQALLFALGELAWMPLLSAVLSALVLLPLAIGLWMIVRVREQLRPGGIVGILSVATLFFGLGAGLLLFPLGWLPTNFLTLGFGVDLLLLGVAVALFDAFDEGEGLRQEMLRSLLGAGIVALLFGCQIGLALLAVGDGTPLRILLFTCIGAAIATQVLLGRLELLLDRLVFLAHPRLWQARATLRANAEALPRLDDQLQLGELDAAAFARLIRRALSHYGDLPRLASSPLTQLSVIDSRLMARGAPDQPIERAAELKALLAESISRLKPARGDFGTSDEWRHYNALYFPYVVGLRPYSRRANLAVLDPIAQQALEWLAAEIPERTLHNWQNAAAQLVAADVRAALEQTLKTREVAV